MSEEKKQPKDLEVDHYQQVQEVLDQVERICEALSEPYSHDNGEDLTRRLAEFQKELSYSDKLYAEAEMFNSLARAHWSEEIGKDYSATLFREILEGKTAIQQRVLKLAERTNSTLKKSIDVMITQLSYLKEQARQK